MELAAGQVLKDNYRLESLLGVGGMGAVWKATDLKLGRIVALKVLHADLRADASLNARFEREARMVASLEHPAIVPIYTWITLDDGEGHEFPCIVMPFVKGKPLADHIRERGALPLDEAVKLTCALLGALSVAHQAGIIHRDLKPQNVMLDLRDGETVVRLLDFGIAKSTVPDAAPGNAPNATQAGMLLGTPAYMSPEQINNPGKVDGRADLWAASVCFYEMITGAIPFTGNTPIETVSKVLTNQGTPARMVNPRLPPDVDGFFNRAFAPQLDQRPRVAKEMEALLQALVNQKSVAPPAPTGWAPQSAAGAPPPGAYQGASGMPPPPSYAGMTPAPQPLGPYQPHTPPPGVAYPGQSGYPAGNTPPPGYPAGNTPPPGYPTGNTPPPTAYGAQSYGTGNTPSPAAYGAQSYGTGNTPPPAAYGAQSYPQGNAPPPTAYGAQSYGTGNTPPPTAYGPQGYPPHPTGGYAAQPSGPYPQGMAPPGMYAQPSGMVPMQPTGYGGLPVQQSGANTAMSGKKFAGLMGLGVAGTLGMGVLILAGVVTFFAFLAASC